MVNWLSKAGILVSFGNLKLSASFMAEAGYTFTNIVKSHAWVMLNAGHR